VKVETGKNLEDIGANDFDVYETLLFFGLKQGAKLQKEEFTFTKEDMEQVLDECFYEFIELIPKFFPDPKNLQPGVLTIPEKISKKK
jgi:hypothetical protein